MTRSFDALVIGAGAAGLMTAWQAGLRGRKVAVLERSGKPGRKILMSGGGRCNFTNLHVTPGNFLSANPHFVKSALKRYTANDFLTSVEQHSVAWHERKHGQLFCDQKADQILSMLLRECEASGAQVITRCEIDRVEHDGHYLVHSNRGTWQADSLVIATGGLSIPSMGSSPFGYEVARQFGLEVLPVRASLVPYVFTGPLKEMFARLSGSSVEASVSCGNAGFTEALLFTHRGLSGPVILQISNYWNSGDAIDVNLVPGHDVSSLLGEARSAQPKILARTLLNRFLPKHLVQELEALHWPTHKDKSLAEWSNDIINRTGNAINNWQIVPAGTEGYRTAEVTFGGIDTDELSSRTMEAKRRPGLYFIGEVVDVTGHLGGFNFQWAWSSAFACAQAL